MYIDMEGPMTLAGATAYFRCDRSCNVSFFKVTSYKNGALVTSSQKTYDLSNNGIILYLENLTIADTGKYTPVKFMRAIKASGAMAAWK